MKVSPWPAGWAPGVMPRDLYVQADLRLAEMEDVQRKRIADRLRMARIVEPEVKVLGLPPGVEL